MAERAAFILAAGASRRMGSPKALLPWAGTTLLQYAIDQARAAHVTDIVVALGPATAHLAQDLGVTTVVNSDPDTGRAASIQMAAQAARWDADAILVQSVDQPIVAAISDRLLTAVEAGAIAAVPVFEGRRGHPVACAGSLLPDLRALALEPQGLRSLLGRHTHTLVEVGVDSDAVLWNLNDFRMYTSAMHAAQT
jgi:CTP:molybdopterin cytidylyltransferase MocA